MADKITTLKTKGGDKVYPNVLDKNIPDTIARTTQLSTVEKTLKEEIAQATNSLKGEIDDKQNTLIAGTNITIVGDTISSTASVPDNVVLYGELTPVA